jgi:predicted 3-demethylubiquinone-9 3-methyltransferase (glyoxalase superfamily)
MTCRSFPRLTGRSGRLAHKVEIHGEPAGSVLTVAFELDGQTFTAFKDRFGVSWQILPAALPDTNAGLSS